MDREEVLINGIVAVISAIIGAGATYFAQKRQSKGDERSRGADRFRTAYISQGVDPMIGTFESLRLYYASMRAGDPVSGVVKAAVPTAAVAALTPLLGPNLHAYVAFFCLGPKNATPEAYAAFSEPTSAALQQFRNLKAALEGCANSGTVELEAVKRSAEVARLAQKIEADLQVIIGAR